MPYTGRGYRGAVYFSVRVLGKGWSAQHFSHLSMRFWFRPTRFWKYFACYSPSSIEGWLATGILFGVGVALFLVIDQRSHSASDTLIAFAPWGIALLAEYDILCLHLGEYPSWWRKRSDREEIEGEGPGI